MIFNVSKGFYFILKAWVNAEEIEGSNCFIKLILAKVRSKSTSVDQSVVMLFSSSFEFQLLSPSALHLVQTHITTLCLLPCFGFLLIMGEIFARIFFLLFYKRSEASIWDFVGHKVSWNY
jgi:hypothetical protein